MARSLHGLGDVRQVGARDICLKVLNPALEGELAVGGAEVGRDRADGAAVQVEAPLGIASGGEEEQCPPGGP